MYIVCYERYNMDRSNRPGFWENLTKSFKSKVEARIFVRNISDYVIVKNIYVKYVK